jgi:hypothetical protein
LTYFLYKYEYGAVKPVEGEWGRRENNGGGWTNSGDNTCIYRNATVKPPVYNYHKLSKKFILNKGQESKKGLVQGWLPVGGGKA